MKKFTAIIMIIILMPSITGCSRTKQEINNLSILLAIGFDLTPEGKYLFTAQILNTQKQNYRSKKAPSSVVVFSSEGNSPYDAMNHMATSLGKNLFLGHSAYIIVGSRLAENGISLVLDSALRSPDTRPNRPLFVTKGNALDIVKAVTTDEKIPANVIDNILRFQIDKGYVPLTSRLDFATALESKTAAPIAGMINLEKNINADNTFKVSGTAVFKKDKLIGYLDKKETRGMQWLNSRVKAGNLVVQTKDNGIISFDILESKTTIKPIVKNNNVTMQVNVKEKSNIIEMTEDIDPMKNPEKLKKLSELQNKAIKSEIELTLNTAQKKLKADIFDFGGKIHRDNPKFWNIIKGNWEKIFPELKIEVNVDSSIKRPGIISKPIK